MNTFAERLKYAMEQAQDYTGAFGNVQKEDPDGDEGGDE